VQGSVNYPGYKSRERVASRGGLRAVARRLLRFIKVDVFYNLILYPYGAWKHRTLLGEANRSQSHTYTAFYRSPSQLETFSGPVVSRVLAGRSGGGPLRIIVLAGSNGAEAYTLAATLLKARPDLDFVIEASDLHDEMVQKASKAIYTRDEVMHSEYISDEFVSDVFERHGADFIVRPSVRSKVTFSHANLLDPALAERFEAADIVFAQNVLFHLPPAAARLAFENIVRLLKPHAALFIEGMDLDLKVELTRQRGLTPFEERHREIYEQSRAHISLAWWNYYYGAEPYSWLRSDRVRRYSAIFFN